MFDRASAKAAATRWTGLEALTAAFKAGLDRLEPAVDNLARQVAKERAATAKIVAATRKAADYNRAPADHLASVRAKMVESAGPILAAIPAVATSPKRSS